MGSHFHNWIDYNVFAFSTEFTRMGSNLFWIFGVSRDSKWEDSPRETSLSGDEQGETSAVRRLEF